MKRFDEKFKTRLYDTIADIENNSLVEVVMIIRARAARYSDMPLLWGIAFAVTGFSLVMFLPSPFHDLMIFGVPLLSFLTGYALVSFLDPLRRLFIPRKRLLRNVELLGRATFQKGGIHHTSQKTGVLIFVSLFEREVLVLPDRGAETSMPPEEWETIQTGFKACFEQPELTNALLKCLEDCKPIFANYIPPVENDINELPDNLEVDI